MLSLRGQGEKVTLICCPPLPLLLHNSIEIQEGMKEDSKFISNSATVMSCC